MEVNSIKCHFVAAGEYKQFTEKFGAQNFYVEIDKNSEYPGLGEFQVNNKKIDLAQFSKGDEIEICFNIKGRKWEKDGRKGFVQNLEAWKIETLTKSESPKPNEQPEEDGDDDLPF